MMPGNPSTAQSEDCLNLNIYKPQGKTNLPILFWIHGGGYTIGSGGSTLYAINPDLAGNAVLVTMNYRLGAFGFFAHPDLSTEDAYGVSGNQGSRDIILALKWVNNNARAIGGDPTRITVFGQSAGANAITLLLTSPEASGLFTAAILHSGTGLVPSASGPVYLRSSDPNIKTGESVGIKLAQVSGCDNDRYGRTPLECLRAIPKEGLQDLFYKASGGDEPTPYFDGQLLGPQPISALRRFKTGQFNQVPIVMGLNGDEFIKLEIVGNSGITWQAANDKIRKAGLNIGVALENLEKLVGVYSAYPSAAEALAYFHYDTEFLCPVTNFLKSMPYQSVVRVPVRGYYYTHAAGFLPLTGSLHGAELPFLFGTDPYKRLFLPAEYGFASNFQKAWTSIAQGAPYVEGVGDWPALSTKADNRWVQIDYTMKLIPGIREKECTVYDQLGVYDY